MRSAAAVQQLIRKLVPGVSAAELEQIGEFTRNYLSINQPQTDRVLMPEEAEELKGGN